MSGSKYIIFDVNGLDTPVVFPSFIEHDRIKIGGWKPIRAGFVSIGEDGVFVSGKSISLNLVSALEDVKIIKRMLDFPRGE